MRISGDEPVRVVENGGARMVHGRTEKRCVGTADDTGSSNFKASTYITPLPAPCEGVVWRGTRDHVSTHLRTPLPPRIASDFSQSRRKRQGLWIVVIITPKQYRYAIR